jgi:ribosomal protein S18 acetylase RimI-like enzyme
VANPSSWTRVQQAYHAYHHPDYFCPEPYEDYPSHLHIDLLPRAQGRGYGRRMMETLIERLRQRGSRGAHLGVNVLNTRAYAFYRRLGFHELTRVGTPSDGCVYLGLRFDDPA